MYRFITIFVFLLSINYGVGQNGKLLSKKLVDISKTPIWNRISENDKLQPDFDHLNKLNFYNINYLSDDLKVQGLLVEPKEEGKYPVVIFNRGGNRDFGKLTIATLIFYTSKLAAQGYVVIGSNYRKNDAFGGAEINDVLYLTETIKAIESADPSRIGMYGWSRGVVMTYLALQKSNEIKTAIVGNGPCDLFELAKFRPELETKVFAECIPNYWKNREIELKKRSAIFWADELDLNSSLLILSGQYDKRVNPEQADRMAGKLKSVGYDFKLMKFDTDHYFSDKKPELNTLIIDCFNNRLKHH
ncbi:prolyl oligopeptidase family serine peptidase [Tamlana agarivorans]|uniref:Prolyl oligopeptidase family serine peptidase n=1 Tax=Pseudotamlana agarivorans TaxID=481183 RepID=A0ACC5U5Y8_9FLAO|nr:prolyl oligopeptidase family serine peptidase [Tamlana agarivorans]MBU2949743.1 prolyl oligopeptidase family serine peptidase [Tamlana agarivorans]